MAFRRAQEWLRGTDASRLSRLTVNSLPAAVGPYSSWTACTRPNSVDPNAPLSRTPCIPGKEEKKKHKNKGKDKRQDEKQTIKTASLVR